jgi:mono/diheme cytochrome c family protein
MNWRIGLVILVLAIGVAFQGCRAKRVSATTTDSPGQSGSPAAEAPGETASPAATPGESGSPTDEAPAESGSPAADARVESASPASPTAAAPPLTYSFASIAARSYDTEQSWSDPLRVIPLNYQQAQGKRVFYNTCVWCHADVTPAGPSNRSNLSPTPPLINDGATLNQIGDEYIQNIVTLGGSAMGKSAMMPPWGQTLSQDEIQAVIAYIRTVAEPPYEAPGRPPSQYRVK